MGKVEQDGKIEQFKTAMNNRDYDTAVQIADTLDIKHIRDNNLLCLIADAYELSNDYELAKQVLLYAYENTKAGRHLAYRLCLVSINNGEIDEAEEYYEDFVEMAPKDTGRYVLKYKMAEALNKPKDELIKILEEYVNIDMEEKWAYELAKLYKETGDTAKCVELCDEMGLWFSEGRYIKKAMELKKTIQPLNITQQQLLDKEDPVEEEKVVEKPKSEPHVSKSPLETIMEKQPERTPYVEPEEPSHFGIDLKEEGFGEEKLVKPGLDKPLGESNFEAEVQNTDSANEYKPSFDITEIKVADEPKIQPENILTAQPVEEGPQQMSFFNDDSPSNNKYEQPNETQNYEKPDFLKEENIPDISEKPAEEPLPDVDDVEDMLKSLQERGILGADTVNKAVDAINSDTHQIEEELKEEVDSIMSEQEEPKDETLEEPITEEVTSDEPTVEEVASEEPVTKGVASEEPATNTEDFEKPQNRYTREEPEEIEAEKTDDSKFHTVQIGNKWEADDEREIESNLVDNSDKAPVEAGELDDFEPELNDSADLGETKDIGDVMHKPTEVMPDGEELEKESKKPIQAAKVLDEAVKPTSEQSKDVPVFDLSGEYTTQDNSKPELEETPAPKIEKVLKESNESSAQIDMISGETPDNKPELPKEESKEEPKVEPKEEPKEELNQNAEDLGATKVVDVSVKKELKHEMSKEKNKELNTERVKFDVEDSDMAVFGNYLNVEGLEDAVKKVCNNLIKKFTGQEKDINANVIVMGDEKTGKTTMAIEIIKLVNKKSERRNRKIAKISASTLNRKGFASILNQIKGCDLIIENAHEIHQTTIQEIVKYLYPNNTDSIIILEAETEPMEDLLSSTVSLGQTFNNVIKIKQYNIREWVAYGSEYAETQGYKLDEVAELALFKSIDDAFGAHIGRLDVEEIIDKAIARSDRFGKKLFGSKKDDKGLKLLDESDFNISLK